jgi:hypothetical protein
LKPADDLGEATIESSRRDYLKQESVPIFEEDSDDIEVKVPDTPLEKGAGRARHFLVNQNPKQIESLMSEASQTKQSSHNRFKTHFSQMPSDSTQAATAFQQWRTNPGLRIAN